MCQQIVTPSVLQTPDMSKAQLRKELAQMSKDQLIELVMNAYTANIEPKKYFEFFLNPDVEKMLVKNSESVLKELRRTKWGRSRARISAIKKTIKEVTAYDPGDEYVLKFMFTTLLMLINSEMELNYPSTLYNGTVRLASDIMKFADSHSLMSTAIESFDKILQSESIGTRTMLRDIKSAVTDYSGKL